MDDFETKATVISYEWSMSRQLEGDNSCVELTDLIKSSA